MSRKKKNYLVQNILITDYAAEGKSIAKQEDGKVIFVPQAVPGDLIDIWITKDKKTFAEGRLHQLIEPSPLRIEPFCKHFGTCGGCKWQMLSYAHQLKYKQQQVADQLSRIGHLNLPEIEPIIGCENTTQYRNKLEFTFSALRYFTPEEIALAADTPLTQSQALGFHAPQLFDKVVPIQHCYLQPEPTNLLLKTLNEYTVDVGLEFYHARAHTGWLRNIIIRVATTGEVLINLILKYEDEEKIPALLNHLIEKIPAITSLNYTINGKLNDSIYDQKIINYLGKPFIEERLEDFKFRISPQSFFQTNTLQAEKLYQQTKILAGLTGKEVLYDLYCGTGSIGIFCSKTAKKVIGIEVIPEAITDAKINAEINNITNCQFFEGDVSTVCTETFFNTHGRPDVIITDPPRVGMHEKLINQLLLIKAPKIVYVSCNPATQARDLALLSSIYTVKKVQPVDMFPHTHHIENIVLLELS